MGVFDLTHTIRPDMPVFPGTPAPVLQPAASLETAGFRETSLTLTLPYRHPYGPPPAHLLPHGATLDAYPVDRLIGRGFLLDCRGRAIEPPLLAEIPPEQARGRFFAAPYALVEKLGFPGLFPRRPLSAAYDGFRHRRARVPGRRHRRAQRGPCLLCQPPFPSYPPCGRPVDPGKPYPPGSAVCGALHLVLPAPPLSPRGWRASPGDRRAVAGKMCLPWGAAAGGRTPTRPAALPPGKLRRSRSAAAPAPAGLSHSKSKGACPMGTCASACRKSPAKAGLFRL